MEQQAKQGPGRRRKGQGTQHIDLTLSVEVIEALRKMPAGERSKFVDEALRQHPQIAEALKDRKEQAYA